MDDLEISNACMLYETLTIVEEDTIAMIEEVSDRIEIAIVSVCDIVIRSECYLLIVLECVGECGEESDDLFLFFSQIPFTLFHKGGIQ